jgi:GWxTD domain-containing protein
LAQHVADYKPSDKGRIGQILLDGADVDLLREPAVIDSIRDLTRPRSKTLYRELERIGANPDQALAINGFLSEPDQLYIRYFIYNFFTGINPANPGKAWKEYSEKVVEVNKIFKTAGKAGYITERGFYYLKFGKPTDVIQVENENGTLPYEIWQYDVLPQANNRTLNNGLLLFYKPNPAIDDYILLHSNIDGEHQNMNWRSLLYTNPASGNNQVYRAEQYFPSNH